MVSLSHSHVSVSSKLQTSTMSYLYSKPHYFYQHLHNWLAKVIVTVGRFIGYFWLDPSSTQEFKKGSKLLLTRTICTATYLIGLQIHMSLSFHLAIQEASHSKLSLIIAGITQVSFNILLLVIYWIAITKRKEIIEILNTGIAFRFSLSKRIVVSHTSNNHAKKIVYHLIFKFFVDFIMIFASLLLMLSSFYNNPQVIKLLYIFVAPLVFTIYCLVSTIYHVAFVYASFLFLQLRDDLITFEHNQLQISYVTHLYERILKYTKRVNNLLQVMLLILFEEAFVGLVDQVRTRKNEVMC